MYSYNPWKSKFKEPFGAVSNNSTMTIRFFADRDVQVKLIIHRDFGAWHEFDLVEGDDNYYETTVEFDHGRALYFYYFEIIKKTDWGMKRSFYSAPDEGGEGHEVEDREQVKEYQVSVYEGDDSIPEWYQDAVFYQIFPDRFNNGNDDGHVDSPKPNSFLYARKTDDPFYVKDDSGEVARWDFYGGNIQGIIKKLPYLQELGITALYLNPIFLATSNHRYDTMNYMKIDSVLGSEDDFIELVKELHDRGMHLMLDGVFSHVGDDSIYFNRRGTFGEKTGAAKDQNSPYYNWFKFSKWPDEYKTWWGFKNMPEIDKNHPDFQNFIYGDKDSVLSKWNALGVDGWRLDVADELPDDFIRGIRANLKKTGNQKVLIGEVWEDASNKIAYEQRRNYILGDALQGVMNYPLRDMIIQYVVGNTTAREMAVKLMIQRENYPAPVFYGNLNNLGTHDTERILTMVGDENLPLAVALLFVMPGIPCIYYGDEAGLTGDKDPQNRKYFPWNDIHASVYKTYHHWAHLRLDNETLRRGNFNIGYYENNLIIMRHYQGKTSLFIANSEETEQEVKLSEVKMMRDQEFSQAVVDSGKVIKVAPESAYFEEV